MQSITVFESHFKAAQVMLKVYRLLDSDLSRSDEDSFVPKLREMMSWDTEEPLVLLLNDLFLGAVRERADLAPAFFERPNLSLLLRQAVVSSCTAMDVFFPSLLETHLPAVIQVRQRNFLPGAGEVRTLFQDFRLKLDEVVPFLEEEEVEDRWSLLTRRVLHYCRGKTLSNVDGVSAVMLMLGVNDPWRQIAGRAGTTQSALQGQIRTLVKRRNDIVHRGDRLVGKTEGPPESIDYAWTYSHLNAVESVAHACDALAKENIEALRAEAGVA